MTAPHPSWLLVVAAGLAATAFAGQGGPALAATPTATPTQADDATPRRVSAPGRYQGYSEPVFDGSERSSFHIQVRDGTRLAVDLFRPTRDGRASAEPLPVIWMHTPYNRRNYRRGPTIDHYTGYAAQLLPYGYNVAVVDYRGVNASFGQNHARTRGQWLEHARWDAYDVTEWLARQPWSTGRIGMWGCSATGTSQLQAATTRPPSLKAIMPLSIEFDSMPLGGIVDPVQLPQPGQTPDLDVNPAPVDGANGDALLAQALSEHRHNILSVGDVPFRDSVSPTLGVQWWLQGSPVSYLDALRASGIGIYVSNAWEEAGARRGGFDLFNNVPNVKAIATFGAHCRWDDVKQASGFDIVVEELRFFDHWLKGIDNGVMDEPGFTYYTYHAPGDGWRQSRSWPPAGSVNTAFHVGSGSLQPDFGTPGEDVVLTGPRPSTNSVTTQVHPANAGISYLGPQLEGDVELSGHPVMRLWLATELEDVDVLARLDDIAPDGTVASASHYMLGQLRATHRALAQAPYDTGSRPYQSHRSGDVLQVEPGQPMELVFELLPMSYVFRAGHRMRMNLSFARPHSHPQEPGTVRILRTAQHPSVVLLPVVGVE
ncbi:MULTISPECIES: CocE/NonD family hydrolase [unclassified Luteimonas]